MLIERMPEVLRWTAGDEVFRRVHDAYVARLSEALGKTLAEIRREDPALGEEVVGAVRAASDEALWRVLTAPETSERLLWSRAHSPGEIGAFLAASFWAERASAGCAATVAVETWTALGDAGFFPDRAPRRMPRVAGLMPLDFGSPYATKVDLSGAERTPPPPRPGFDEYEEGLVLARLGEAQRGIRRTRPEIADFVVLFNKVLILQKDPETPRQFASGSNGQYIGRSFLTNPHDRSVDPVHLADAVVHEGIHALLYMQEQEKRWVFDPALYAPDPRVTSPWSGNVLALRPFLQACFVWYGLLHFWCLALTAGAFERDRVKAQIVQSLRGFLGPPLLDLVSDYTAAISPDLQAAIREMQANVMAAFAAVA